MAEHAEMANFTSGFDELPHKLEVLERHCADVGRDPATINKTPLCSVVVGKTMEEAVSLRNQFLADRGLDWDALDDGTRAMLGARLIVGDPDSAGERAQALVGLGLDGICANLPANAHDPEAVARTVGVLRAAVG
jgi:alkanesulfonate monooxygenase SsuD/methylene tetrahydromethanopterin reductase-like flavin-dependent oxidoreductase (luciferase family)